MAAYSSSIGECSRRCLDLFSESIDAAQHLWRGNASRVKNELQDEFARFKLWASNIGVFADIHASLDFRIRELADVKELFLTQLDTIERRLDQVRDDITSKRQEEEKAASERNDPLVSANSIMKIASAEADFKNWDSTKLLQSIHESIAWLHRLSNLVRKASFNNQNRRAKAFNLHDSEGNESEELTEAMLAGLKKFFEYIVKQNTKDLADYLTTRLVETMIIRHKRILYRRSRQERWTMSQIQFTTKQAEEPKEEPRHQTLPEITQEPRLLKIASKPTPKRKLTSIRNTATTVDVASYRKTAPSRVSRASSAPLKHRDQMSIPPPPSTESKEFVCPYCSLILQSSEISNGVTWAKHVQRDLDAYICVFEECDNPLEIYSTSKQWLSHMSTQHRMRWQCFATNHEPLVYDRPEAFEDHMKMDHAGNFPEDQLPFIVEISAQSITPTLEHCPFCPEGAGNSEEHVGHHLREFALLSLPWPDYAEGGSQYSSQCQSESLNSQDSQWTLNESLEWLPLPDFDDVECDDDEDDNNEYDVAGIGEEAKNRLGLYGHLNGIVAQHEPLILESLNDKTIEAFACKKYKVYNMEALVRLLSGEMTAFKSYKIGWICCTTIEYVAAQTMLDEQYEGTEMDPTDDNIDYALGRMCGHDVVIACVTSGEYGRASTEHMVPKILRSFPHLRFGLLVGVGGGAPSQWHDIRLGDVVVSSGSDNGALLQYKLDKTKALQQVGFLKRPPSILRAAIVGQMAQYEKQGHRLQRAISNIMDSYPSVRRIYRRPDVISDRLYQSDVYHQRSEESGCTTCGDDSSTLILRSERDELEDDPAIHYGTIATSPQLIQDATLRDRLAAEKDILCFETGAAGLSDGFPCVVIRGICDYSDSHMNNLWQGYAAMTAAAYAKDLLRRISPYQVEAQVRIRDTFPTIWNQMNEPPPAFSKTYVVRKVSIQEEVRIGARGG